MQTVNRKQAKNSDDRDRKMEKKTNVQNNNSNKSRKVSDLYERQCLSICTRGNLVAR